MSSDVMRSPVRASQLGEEPHEDQTPDAVGQDEDFEMELRVGKLSEPD